MRNSDFPIEIQIMNLAMNMARVSEWVADSSKDKSELVKKFIKETEGFLYELSTQNISKDFKPTLVGFSREFDKLKAQNITNKNRLEWSERALTWANILQSRAKLA